MNYKLLGQRLQECRIGQSISQEALAEMAGISVTYVSAIENARRHLSLVTLVNIANALKITPDYLLLGNLPHDKMTCRNEVNQLLQGCTAEEQYFILSVVKHIRGLLIEYHRTSEGR